MLVTAPSELADAETWSADLRRSGAVEVEVRSNTIETTLAPPLSQDPLFTRYLLPLWVGKEAAMQAKALRLLDEIVTAAIKATVHIGCVRGRRGVNDIEDSTSG